MVLGTLYSYPDNFRAYKVLISAKYGGHDIKLDPDFTFGETNQTPEFLAKFPLGRVPAVELEGGVKLSESNAAAFYLCNDEMVGGECRLSRAQVIRWMSFSDNEIVPASCNWVYPVLGILPDSPARLRGKEDLCKLLNVVNQELKMKTWLVGERMSLGDICLACSLVLAFQRVLGPAMRAEFPHVTRWFNTVVNQPIVKGIVGSTEFIAEDLEGKSQAIDGKKSKRVQIACKLFACTPLLYFYILFYKCILTVLTPLFCFIHFLLILYCLQTSAFVSSVQQLQHISDSEKYHAFHSIST